jgi:hypothetical protein
LKDGRKVVYGKDDNLSRGIKVGIRKATKANKPEPQPSTSDMATAEQMSQEGDYQTGEVNTGMDKIVDWG